jgi:hypothetical protein
MMYERVFFSSSMKTGLWCGPGSSFS